MTSPQRRRLLTFLVLAFGLSIPWYLLIASGGGLTHHSGAVLALMWCPAGAAIITQLLALRSLRGLGWGWPGLRWIGVGYLLPVGYSLVAYSAVWVTRLGGVDLSRAPEGKVAFLILGTLISLVSATGEEIGWRGFL